MESTTAPSWVDRELYPFTTRTVNTSSGTMHGIDDGQGSPVLFVHGTPSWSFEFRHLVGALRATHRCIAPDLLGFGLSERPRDFGYSPEAHAGALREFVEDIGLDRFTLVAHDFGGPISLPLALAGRVSRLVLINTWMWPLDDPALQRQAKMMSGPVGKWLYTYANISLRVLMPFAYATRSTLTPQIHAQYLQPFTNRADRALVLHPLAKALLGSSQYYAQQWRQRENLRHLPTLLLWGERDLAFGAPFLARWQSALPDAAVRSIPAGHWPHEEQPDEAVRAIKEFFNASVH
jgi:haloalkane dehalogenase